MNLKVLMMVISISITSSVAQDYSMIFNGANNYVSYGDVHNLDTSDFTIEALIKISGTDAPGNKILNKGLTSVGIPENAGYALRASKTADDEIEFQIGNSDGSTKRVLYNGVFMDEWYHVAGVRLGKELFLYLNGELVAEDSTESIYNVNTDVPFAIGAIHKANRSSTNEFMDGIIDEVRIWNYARSRESIRNHMDCSISQPDPNLVAVYNFNDTLSNYVPNLAGIDTGEVIGSVSWEKSIISQDCADKSKTDVRQSKEINNRTQEFRVNNILLDFTLNNELAMTHITILNLKGEIVINEQVKSRILNLDIEGPGIYTIVLKSGKTNINSKSVFIK